MELTWPLAFPTLSYYAVVPQFYQELSTHAAVTPFCYSLMMTVSGSTTVNRSDCIRLTGAVTTTNGYYIWTDSDRSVDRY